MTNSDNSFGIHNKITRIFEQYKNVADGSGNWIEYDGSTATTLRDQDWADVNAAKSHVFTDEALSVWNSCATQIQWAIVADSKGNANNALKVTAGFGVPSDPTAKGWGTVFNENMTTLKDANNWFKHYDAELDGADNSQAGSKVCPQDVFIVINSNDHLF